MRVLAVLAAALLLSAGCSSPREQAQVPDPAIEEPPQLTVMPDLRYLTMQQAAKALGSTDVDVVVTFPGYEATISVEATRIAGAYVAARVESTSVSDRQMTLGDAADALHRVTEQEPAPGTPLSEIATAALTAGPHPPGTGGRWLTTGHILGVGKSAAPACFNCHRPEECMDCHQRPE